MSYSKRFFYILVILLGVLLLDSCRKSSQKDKTEQGISYNIGQLQTEIRYKGDLLPDSCEPSGDPMLSVQIGTQFWTVNNLFVDTFRNGDIIPEARTDKEWREAGLEGQPAWCYYLNHSCLGAKLGKLYNFHAIEDERGLAPEGWHIPTDEEWNKIKKYLVNMHGDKMKNTDSWFYDGNGNNESGFSALPGGMRDIDGQFVHYGEMAFFWTGSNCVLAHAWLHYFSGDYGDKIFRTKALKGVGLSVRCVKDYAY